MLNEANMTVHQRGVVLRVLLNRLRHEGCGGRPSRVELLTSIDGVSSRPVRKIVLLSGAERAPDGVMVGRGGSG